MTSVAIGIDPRGVPVAIKRPRDGRRAAAEVEALKAAARPGVVALVNFDALDNVITTEWVSGETLSSVAQSRRPPQHVAEIIASVAATLTELHAAGITHQRLDGSHVILEPSGHTTVLGFSGAALDNRGNPLDDVVALGRLLLSLLGTMTVAPRPSAGRRVLMPRQPRPDALVGLLRSIGQRGVDQPCTASEFAQQLTSLPSPSQSAPRTGPFAHILTRAEAMPRARILLAFGVAVLVLGFIIGSTFVSKIRFRAAPRSRAGSLATSLLDAVTETSPTTVSAATILSTTIPGTTISGTTISGTTISGTTISGTTISATTILDAGFSGAPTPGDSNPAAGLDSLVTATPSSPAVRSGATSVTAVKVRPNCPVQTCVESHALGDGTITNDGHTFRIRAGANDQVLVADWDCNGTAIPALLRVPSGVIDVFDSWPTNTATVARRIAGSPDAAALIGVNRQTCPTLAIVHRDGTIQEITS